MAAAAGMVGGRPKEGATNLFDARDEGFTPEPESPEHDGNSHRERSTSTRPPLKNHHSSSHSNDRRSESVSSAGLVGRNRSDDGFGAGASGTGVGAGGVGVGVSGPGVKNVASPMLVGLSSGSPATLMSSSPRREPSGKDGGGGGGAGMAIDPVLAGRREESEPPSPRLHSLPDNALNPLGLLAE